jgi:hypothetical protein
MDMIGPFNRRLRMDNQVEDKMHRTYVLRGIAIAAALGSGLPADAEMVRINMPTIRVNPSVRVTTPSVAGTAVGRTGTLTANSAVKSATPANTPEQVNLTFQKIETSNKTGNGAFKDSWDGSSTDGSTTGASNPRPSLQTRFNEVLISSKPLGAGGVSPAENVNPGLKNPAKVSQGSFQTPNPKHKSSAVIRRFP